MAVNTYTDYSVLHRECPVANLKSVVDRFVAAMGATDYRIENKHIEFMFVAGRLKQHLRVALHDVELFRGSPEVQAEEFKSQWLDPQLRTTP